jgi:hypothetical protein
LSKLLLGRETCTWKFHFHFTEIHWKTIQLNFIILFNEFQWFLMNLIEKIDLKFSENHWNSLNNNKSQIHLFWNLLICDEIHSIFNWIFHKSVLNLKIWGNICNPNPIYWHLRHQNSLRFYFMRFQPNGKHIQRFCYSGRF